MARYSAISVNAATGVAELIPDIVVNEITVTAEREEVFMPLVIRKDVTGPGEVFNHPVAAALSFAQLGAQTYIDGASPDETIFDTGQRTFTPQFWFVDVILPMDVPAGSTLDVQQAIIDEVGIGWAKHKDGKFAALYTEAPATAPDHEVGTNDVALAYSNFLQNTRLLYEHNAPRPFAGVIHPIQWGELMADNTVIDAAKAGAPGGTLTIQPGGFVTKLFDTSLYVSDQIVEATGLRSMWFSTKRAFAYYFKMLTHPLTGITSELMVGIAWNEARRSFEICNTYQAAFGGVKGTSTTTNPWLVDCAS